MKKSLKKILFIIGILILMSQAMTLAQTAEDIYSSRYAEPLQTKPLKGILSRVIESPFLLLKYPAKKGLEFTEKHHLDKKALWLYQEAIKHGIMPRVGSIDGSAIPYYGADVNFLALTKSKDKFPDFFVNASVLHAPTVYFYSRIEAGAKKIAGTGFLANAFFDFTQKKEESFFGLGTKTSLGDSAYYGIETLRTGVQTGYEFSPSLQVNFTTDYRKVQIVDRSKDKKGYFKKQYSGANLSGINGDEMIDVSFFLKRDTRNSTSAASMGSYQKLLLQYTQGINGSDAKYLKLRTDLAKYFQLWSPRRVLIARFLGETAKQIDDGYVPFYDRAKMGGAGSDFCESATSRGFLYNRFSGKNLLLFNLEYRYTVMEYRGFRIQTAIFADLGQTPERLQKTKLKDFRESYGGGLYLGYDKNTLLAFTAAHSDEGTRFYVKTKLPF